MTAHRKYNKVLSLISNPAVGIVVIRSGPRMRASRVSVGCAIRRVRVVVTVSLLIVRSLWGRFRAVSALHILMSIIGHDVLSGRCWNLTECVLWPGLEDVG